MFFFFRKKIVMIELIYDQENIVKKIYGYLCVYIMFLIVLICNKFFYFVNLNYIFDFDFLRYI